MVQVLNATIDTNQIRFVGLGGRFCGVLGEQQGRPSFSEGSFKSSHAHHVLFFSLANQQKMAQGANKAGLDILSEASAHFGLN